MVVVCEVCCEKYSAGLTFYRRAHYLTYYMRAHYLNGRIRAFAKLVYFERIKKVIEKNNQALVLLPEIFLTNDFKSRFAEFFFAHSRSFLLCAATPRYLTFP